MKNVDKFTNKTNKSILQWNEFFFNFLTFRMRYIDKCQFCNGREIRTHRDYETDLVIDYTIFINSILKFECNKWISDIQPQIVGWQFSIQSCFSQFSFLLVSLIWNQLNMPISWYCDRCSVIWRICKRRSTGFRNIDQQPDQEKIKRNPIIVWRVHTKTAKFHSIRFYSGILQFFRVLQFNYGEHTKSIYRPFHWFVWIHSPRTVSRRSRHWIRYQANRISPDDSRTDILWIRWLFPT